MNRSLALIAIGVALGLIIGWALWFSGSVKESAAVAIVQPDSSVVLARSGEAPDSAPPHIIPKGAKEVRRIQVVVQPSRGIVVKSGVDTSIGNERRLRDSASQGWNPTVSALDSCDCPAVQVDLSLVRMPDKTGRVIASSPSGEILSGIDFPLESLGELPASRPWAAGISFDSDLRLGAFVERDLGPFRIGLDASANSKSGVNSKAWAGVRF